MKFENPIMNISMFEVENVVTEASGVVPGEKTLDEKIAESSQYVEGNTITLNMGE